MVLVTPGRATEKYCRRRGFPVASISIFMTFLPRAFPGLTLCVVAGLLFAPARAVESASDPITDWFQPNPAWQAVESVTAVDRGAKLELVPGATPRVMVLVDAKAKAPHLRSKAYLADIVLSAEYLFTTGAKAAIYLNSAYRIQLDGAGAGTIGPIVVPADPKQPETFLPPLTVAPGAPGVWHRLEVRLRGRRDDEGSNKIQNALLIEAKIDGVVVHANTMPVYWCRGTETEWETTGGNTTFGVEAGSLAVRNFSLQRADFQELALPAAAGGATNIAQLIDYVKQGAELFKGLGCVECHATTAGDDSAKTGPNLFGMFQLEPRDREIAAGEGHRFTVKADRAYLQKSIRSPWDELAIAEHGPTTGNPYLPVMPPLTAEVVTDAQIDAIGAYLQTLNRPAQQGPVVKLVKETGLENYDPMKDRLQFLVDRRVRIQRGPMANLSGRAIHVGLPGGINYSFDPRNLGIVQLWQGGFLNMSGELLNRGGGGLKPGYESREIKLGELGVLVAPLDATGRRIDLSFASPVFKDAAAVRASLHDPRELADRFNEVDAQFLGYERDSKSEAAAPVFKYRVARNTIALRTEFAADGTVRLVLDADLAAPQVFAVNTALLGALQVTAGRAERGRWLLPAGSHRGVSATGRLTLAPKTWQPAPSSFAMGRQPLETKPSQSNLPRGYTAESFLPPKDNYGRVQLFEALGMAVAPDGAVLVATRTAGIWRLEKGEWSPFAEGLFDSLGVAVEDEHGYVVVAGQKAELTRISDVNGDGLADRYDTMTDAFNYTGNYHAYMHGPVRDAGGDYFVTLNLNDAGQPDSVEYKAGGRYMGTGGGYRGWAVRVPAKGGFDPYADGLRSPAGLGVAPDGRLWYADNQGEFMGTSKIFVLKRGAFYGHPSALVDRPGMTPESPEIAWAKVAATREMPAILLPQGRFANSPGNPAWDTTGGKFGPFGGQMFIGDQTQSNLMRVVTEKVGDQEQGVVINFATNLESGVMRPVFLPDGSLLLGQTGRGWQAKGGNVASLQHVRWDGKTVAPAILHVSAVAGGFELTFTAPVPATLTDADMAAALAIKSWTYRDAPDYGSPELDEHPEGVTTVALNADRTVLRVALAKTEQPVVHPQQTARVYQLTVDGKKLWNEAGPGLEAFYTLYAFPSR
jgi:mono/diheme cytochrome c family protein